MTTEEKAKAYNEALERAREYYNSPKTCVDIDVLQNIFPQLRESEDERIRKWLVEYHKQQYEKNRDQEIGLFHKDAIVYLERQKINTEGDFGRGYDCGYEACLNSHGAEWFEKQKEHSPFTKEDEYILNRIIEHLEDEGSHSEWVELLQDIRNLPYQKEQKPAEWDEFDEDCLKRAIWYVENPAPSVVKDTNLALWLKSLSERFNLKPNQECSETGTKGPQEIGDWRGDEGVCKKQKEQKPVEPSDDELQRHQDELYNFKVFAAKQAKEHRISFVHDFEWNNFCAELLSYFNEKQKPAEWSEEDNEMLNSIIKVVCGIGSQSIGLREKQARFLKSLRPKPEQEWSEKDKKDIDYIIQILDDCYAFGKHYLSKKDYENLVNKLMDLRPKPHEEIYQSAKHDLAIRFMNYLDENRPEGKMGLSNGECEDIDKAFKENDWAKIMRYVEKYRPSWKPSDEQMKALIDCTIGNEYDVHALVRLWAELKKL